MDANEIKQLSIQLDELRRKMEDISGRWVDEVLRDCAAALESHEELRAERDELDDNLLSQMGKREAAEENFNAAEAVIKDLEQQLSAAQASLMAHSPEYMDTVAELGERMYGDKV